MSLLQAVGLAAVLLAVAFIASRIRDASSHAEALASTAAMKGFGLLILAFLGHTAIAVFAPVVLSSALPFRFRPPNVHVLALCSIGRELLFGVTAGCSMRKLWHRPAALYVWSAPAFLLVFLLLTRPGSMLENLFLSQDAVLDPRRYTVFVLGTLPFVRTVAYTFGALLCDEYTRTKTPTLHSELPQPTATGEQTL